MVTQRARQLLYNTDSAAKDMGGRGFDFEFLMGVSGLLRLGRLGMAGIAHLLVKDVQVCEIANTSSSFSFNP